MQSAALFSSFRTYILAMPRMPSWKPVFYTSLSLLSLIECAVVSLPQSPHKSAPLGKRVLPTFDANCDAYPDIAAGWDEALNMANVAVRVLQDADPFSDSGPVRTALFGDETLSPTQAIIGESNSTRSGIRCPASS